MENDKIEKTILEKLYLEHFSGRVDSGLIDQNLGWDDSSFRKLLNNLANQGYIIILAIGRYAITAKGILRVEQEKIVTGEIVEKNNCLRTKSLKLLDEIDDDAISRPESHIETMANFLEENTFLVLYNLSLLEDCGYITQQFTDSFKISSRGKEAVADWKEKKFIIDEYDRISTLKNRQTRGREFQKLIASVLRSQGWEVKESVHTFNEEIDIILSKNNSFYLVEIEWLKGRSQTKIIQEIIGKLEDRPETRGIVIAMSGFSEGAIERVIGYRNTRPILLFGRQDIEAVIHQNFTFEKLINEKLSQLISDKSVVYDNKTYK